ncbi:MAG: hypothetical protein JOY81_08260, partial [Alphaproteobacteria bacterium]|nr:hypothetical protein [Alphaproteobacteria bacterium]
VAQRKLSFADVLSQSFRFFFDNLGLFFHLVTIPWIVSLLLRVGFELLDADVYLTALLEKLADLLPTVMFLTTWMRATLLGPGGVDHLPGRSWTARETAFLVYLVKIGGVAFVLLGCFTLMAGTIDPSEFNQATIDPELVRREMMAAPLGTGFFIAALMALRASYGLAGPALDRRFTPREAWTLSRGNAWTIIGVLFVIFFAGAIATMIAAFAPLALVRGVLGGGWAAAIIAWTSAILVSYGGAALAATAQAIMFRELTGWRPGGR